MKKTNGKWGCQEIGSSHLTLLLLSCLRQYLPLHLLLPNFRPFLCFHERVQEDPIRPPPASIDVQASLAYFYFGLRDTNQSHNLKIAVITNEDYVAVYKVTETILFIAWRVSQAVSAFLSHC